MRYIKTFENRYVEEYKIGDYIKFNTLSLSQTTGKIVNIDYKHRYPYSLYVHGIPEYNPIISVNEIVRLLTPEEIEKFEMEEYLNKYNI